MCYFAASLECMLVVVPQAKQQTLQRPQVSDPTASVHLALNSQKLLGLQRNHGMYCTRWSLFYHHMFQFLKTTAISRAKTIWPNFLHLADITQNYLYYSILFAIYYWYTIYSRYYLQNDAKPGAPNRSKYRSSPSTNFVKFKVNGIPKVVSKAPPHCPTAFASVLVHLASIFMAKIRPEKLVGFWYLFRPSEFLLQIPIVTKSFIFFAAIWKWQKNLRYIIYVKKKRQKKTWWKSWWKSWCLVYKSRLPSCSFMGNYKSGMLLFFLWAKLTCRSFLQIKYW